MSLFDAVAVLLRTGDYRPWMFRRLGGEDSQAVDAVLGLREFLIKDV